MSLINKFKSAVGMGGNEEKTHTYRCMVCQSTFETQEPDPGVVACTSCGSADVSQVERT